MMTSATANACPRNAGHQRRMPPAPRGAAALGTTTHRAGGAGSAAGLAGAGGAGVAGTYFNVTNETAGNITGGQGGFGGLGGQSGLAGYNSGDGSYAASGAAGAAGVAGAGGAGITGAHFQLANDGAVTGGFGGDGGQGASNYTTATAQAGGAGGAGGAGISGSDATLGNNASGRISGGQGGAGGYGSYSRSVGAGSGARCGRRRCGSIGSRLLIGRPGAGAAAAHAPQPARATDAANAIRWQCAAASAGTYSVRDYLALSSGGAAGAAARGERCSRPCWRDVGGPAPTAATARGPVSAAAGGTGASFAVGTSGTITGAARRRGRGRGGRGRPTGLRSGRLVIGARRWRRAWRAWRGGRHRNAIETTHRGRARGVRVVIGATIVIDGGTRIADAVRRAQQPHDFSAPVAHPGGMALHADGAAARTHRPAVNASDQPRQRASGRGRVRGAVPSWQDRHAAPGPCKIRHQSGGRVDGPAPRRTAARARAGGAGRAGADAATCDATSAATGRGDDQPAPLPASGPRTRAAWRCGGPVHAGPRRGLATRARAHLDRTAIARRARNPARATLTVTGANTYTGGTTISAGTLQLGNGGTSGSITGDVADNGTLAASRRVTRSARARRGVARARARSSASRAAADGRAARTYGRDAGSAAPPHARIGRRAGAAIIATPPRRRGGDGERVSATDTWRTDVALAGRGDRRLGNGGSTGSVAGDVTDNGTLAFDRSDVVTVGGVVSGTGRVSQLGSGTTVLTGANTYTGGTTISAGTLQLGNGGASGSVTGNITDNGVLAFDRSDAVTVARHARARRRSVSQLATPHRRRRPAGANTSMHAGGTDKGRRTIGGWHRSGSGVDRRWHAGNAFGGARPVRSWLVGDVTDNGTLAFNRADDVSFGGLVSGTGGVAKFGANRLTLTNANSYAGGTALNAGTLVLGNASAIGSGTLAMAQGTTLDFSNSWQRWRCKADHAEKRDRDDRVNVNVGR
ncbi:MAG: hypothetical protein WDW38_003485 [Sanguina aurantia]